MTAIIACLFLLISIGACIFGAVTLQIALAVQAALFCGLFLVVALVASRVDGLHRGLEDVEDILDEVLPTKGRDATPDFHAAMALYQKQSGHQDAAAAVRELAADALRRQGFLR